MTKRIVVSITGASGVAYGVRLLDVVATQALVSLVVTQGARKVLETEGGDGVDLDAVIDRHQDRITVLDDSNIAAGPASGSYPTDGMVVIPCSMDTLAAIASGSSRRLTHRAAHVTLKEGRKLVLVPRETPLNIIFIENLLRVARAGATVLPASPGFYHKPKTIVELVDFVVGKALDQFGISHDLYRRWGS
ncbi:MAG: UbiX family flavin prenyltransferase [Planctomycetota bacterium]|nr:UbiX family flavin prenyltransferase [Planctomycetota bacterium]